MLENLRQKLFSQTDIHSLVFIRITFGLIMFCEVIRLLYLGRIDYYFIAPEFHFKYYGFSWVQNLGQTLGPSFIHILFFTLAVLAIFIAIGIFYRLSLILFLFGFTYIFLIDKAIYLNHYYMVIIFSFLLCFMPANRFMSVDSTIINPKIHTTKTPYWCILLLKIQLEILLIYAGLIKINPDWLQLYPLKIWFARQGGLFDNIWMMAIGSYGSILIHIIGAPMLFFKKTRIWIFLIYIIFHSINSYVFTHAIGIFPWLTIALTTIFFEPNWPTKFFKKLGKNSVITNETKSSITKQNIMIAAMFLWILFHSLFPLRKYLYHGNASWTHLGHYFAWQLKLNDYIGMIDFKVIDNKTRQRLKYDIPSPGPLPDEMRHLTNKQFSTMGCKPSLILQYTHYLKKVWSKKIGHDDISVYVDLICSLNHRQPRYMIDRNIDLTKVKADLKHTKWVLPLDPNLKPGEVTIKSFNRYIRDNYNAEDISHIMKNKK